MNVLQRIKSWLGFGMSVGELNAIAMRNMPVIAIGGILATLFAGMLSFYAVTGIPCPVDGFDNALHDNPVAARNYKVFCPIATAVVALITFLAWTYYRRKLRHPRLASALAILFALLVVMIWGVAMSGRPIDNQVLIFASLQFLISGLLVFLPFDSLVYFGGSFVLFGIAMNLSGVAGDHNAGELMYLATLDILVSWIVYSLFRRGIQRERRIADQSRRDELTGAKNRHYLRDDCAHFIGKQEFIMLCDIDDFKHYNDSMSHDVGDKLLKDFYFALREAFGDECTYRYGGDEFLVVSPDFDEAEFLRKVEHCKKQLQRVTVEGTEANLTFSGGYSFGKLQTMVDFRSMLHKADEVLLEAKRAGKNRVSGHAFD